MTNFIKIVNPLTHCTLSTFTISSNLRHLGPKGIFILTQLTKTVSPATLILVTEVGDKCEMLVTVRFYGFGSFYRSHHVNCWTPRLLKNHGIRNSKKFTHTSIKISPAKFISLLIKG